MAIYKFYSLVRHMKRITFFIFLFISGCTYQQLGQTTLSEANNNEEVQGLCIEILPLKEKKGCSLFNIGKESFTQDEGPARFFLIGIQRNNLKEPQSLLLREMVGRTGVIWETTDQIDWPKLPEDNFVSIGGCNVNGVLDKRIIAQVERDEKEWLKAKEWARIADLEIAKFVKVSPNDIKCKNKAWSK